MRPYLPRGRIAATCTTTVWNKIENAKIFYDAWNKLCKIKVQSGTPWIKKNQFDYICVSYAHKNQIENNKSASILVCFHLIIQDGTIWVQMARHSFRFLAATKQLYKWYFPSVCPSVRLSVCLSVRLSVCPSVRPSVTPFWLCSHHRIIMKFSGVITNDQSKVHAKGQGQWSKVKVTEVTTQLNRFRTVTPVWNHLWWWNDAYSLMLLRRGALLYFKVIHQISRSHGSKNRRIWPRLGVSGL